MSRTSWKGSKMMWKLAHLKLNKRHSPILEQPFLIGRVLPGRTPFELASGFDPGRLTSTEKTVDVRVPYFVYDDFLKAFFQHEWDFVALDNGLACQSGDTVLMQRLSDVPETGESISLKQKAVEEFWNKDPDASAEEKKPLSHKVLECIYRLGDIVDPASGLPVVDDRFRHQIESTAELYGRSESDFRYESRPRRGSLEGIRDFTGRKTYKKWHMFKEEDKYGVY